MRQNKLFRLFLVVLLVGIATGIGAGVLSIVMHFIEILAFGHSERDFRIITDQTTEARRFYAVLVSGIVATLGWYLLMKFKSFLNINEMISGKNPPFWQNLVHAFLQVIVVGFGAPVGREVAPRELGSLFASKICFLFGISGSEFRLIVACGAGAGLGAVYNVPFAGAIFTLEILLKSFEKRAVLVAFSVSGIATLVAKFGVSSEIFYVVSKFYFTPINFIIAILVGLIIGVVAKYFQDLVKKSEKDRTKDVKILILLPFVFLLTAALGIYFPEILGNGRSIAQLAFDTSNFRMYLVVLFLAKGICVLAILRFGGYGGTLTPSFSLGAVLGLIIGFGIMNFTQVDLVMVALCGAGAFLAINLNAPLTAFALTIGFSDINFNAYLLVAFSIICAIFVKKIITGEDK